MAIDQITAPIMPAPGTHDQIALSRAIRRALVVLALIPLTVILAVKAAHLGTQLLVNIYGIGVLASTVVIMYIAFTPLVSCLVAVRDDVLLVERCIRSLLAQSYATLEVIVVDDVSGDGTRELVIRLEQELPIQVLLLDTNVGKKRALTLAAQRATGSFFVFTDSDCVLDPNAIERCLLAFQAHPGIGAVSGHARALNADQNLLTRMQDVWYDGQFGVAKAAESVFGSVTCVSGPLAAFRREAIYNYLPAWAGDRFLGGEFRFATDRQLTGYVLGQKWIGADLKRKYADSPMVSAIDYPERRWSVAYVRSARAWTQVPDGFSRMVRQQVRWKKSFVRNMFFTGIFYWRRGIYPTAIFYSHAVWVVMAPVLAARHLIWLPLQGQWLLVGLYLAGVLFKGTIWGLAYRRQNRGDRRWVYRPLMSLLSAVVLSWLLVYSILSLRKNVWSRG
jgi:cellulose synthase/poly-beta-1,6-N-acetylglucosamine synthase-like glycosyltransferase